MGSTVTSLAILVLVLMVYFALPLETREIDTGIFNSMTQNMPDLSSVKEIYDSAKEKMPDLSSSVKDAVNNLDAAVRETANYFLQDEAARSDLTWFAESVLLPVMLELAKAVPGGVPAYNIVSKSFRGSQSFDSAKDMQCNQAQFAMIGLVTEFAKVAGFYAIEKGAKSFPGGEPAYKMLLRSIRTSQLLHDRKELEGHKRELKELRARIDRLEKEGCGCYFNDGKLDDQPEIPKLDLGS